VKTEKMKTQELDDYCGMLQDMIPHNLTTLSFAPEANIDPSGEKATLFNQSVWPVRMRNSFPLPVSHNLTVRSQDAEASNLPSGEKATLRIWLV